LLVLLMGLPRCSTRTGCEIERPATASFALEVCRYSRAVAESSVSPRLTATISI